MPKKVKELSATEVRRLAEKPIPGFHAAGGVPGLYLTVSSTAASSWILRTKIGTRRRDIGLGGFPEVKLAQARERALAAKDKIKAGIDPVAERKEARSRLLAQQVKEVNFDQCAAEVIKKKQTEASNSKHAQQWENTLKTYASPVLGSMRVEDIEISHVLKVLKPIWATKNETATRVRQRIEAVLAWATVHGHRSGDNPARWKGNLDASELPKPATVSKGKNHAALPYARIAEFMADLRSREGMAARALELAVLTAARSNEIRGAQWDEIDLFKKVWTIPAYRMKAKKEHRVPLSDTAVALLKDLPRFDDSGLVFPALRGGQMSVNTMAAVIKRMNASQSAGKEYTDPRQENHPVTQHGFRSTFRDWAGECTAYPGEAIEQALAHTIRNAAEAAYRRGDMLDKRRRLMADWATYCQDGGGSMSATVTPIRSEV